MHHKCEGQEPETNLTDLLKWEYMMKCSILFVLVLLPGMVFAETGRESKVLELPVAGINILRIQCGAGYLNVNGIEDFNKIEVNANIFIEGLDTEDLRSFIENNLLLDLKKRGNRAVLRAMFLSSSRFRPSEAKIDLFIRAPMRMGIRIDDGSGPINVSRFTGNLEIDDGTGSIMIRDIIGKVRIGDRSGPINVEGIEGNVQVKDGSGSIDITKVLGDVNIMDGSGSIMIQDIEGHVKVSDGSGSIEVHDISKNVSILEKDSGEISLEGVAGKIIRRDLNAPDEESEISDDVE